MSVSSPDLLSDRFDDRLLAEAVRLHEESGSLAVDVDAPNAAGRAAGGGFEHRIVVRAREIDKAAGLTAALTNVRGAARFAVLSVLVLAAAAGAVAVQAAMGADRDSIVNVYVLLVAVLGVETVALILWCLVTLAAPSGAHGVPGRIVAEFARRLVLLTHRSAAHISGLRATTAVLSGSGLGRWAFGAVTHAAWAFFLAMALAMMLFLLSTRSYLFVWETTILSADVYVGFTRILAAGPELLGFAVPSPAEVADSQWLGQGEARDVARDAWSGLLVGSVILYGLLPRLALFGLCSFMYLRTRRRFRLDTARPGYARLEARLMPRAEELGFVDSGEGIHPQKPSSRSVPAGRRIKGDPAGPVAVLGLETAGSGDTWPPAIGQSQILDLGHVTDGDEFRDAVETLRLADPAPRLLILVCSLVSTPDRGMSAYLDSLLGVVEMPVGLILTDGQKLRDRAVKDDIQLRIADWRALAHRAGVSRERVLEVDLRHATDASLAKLAAFAGETVHGGPKAERLTKAFALIVAESARWPEVPSPQGQAELHRSITRLYREDDPNWTRIFETRGLTEENLAARLQAGSEMLIGMLPGRMAADPVWLTAGATAGALGCVATATLLASGAIAGLPLWAGLGAALASAISGAVRKMGATPPEAPDLADAVRAAALLSLVLDAQGHNEMAITRMIDDALSDEAPELRSEDQISNWLDHVHLRYRESERREAMR